MRKEDLLTIRDARQEDTSFIMATWLKGIYHGGDPFFRKIPKNVFMSGYPKLLSKILTSPGVVVKVACLKEDQDVIVGYSVYRQGGGVTVLDFVYIKKDWRGIGLARDLLPSEAYAATHLTRAGEAVLTKLYPNAIFNPFL